MDNKKRLFFGFEVHAPWPESLPTGRMPKTNEHHITVAFLGETSHEKILRLLPEIPKPPFKIGIVGAFDGCLFLPENNPRVVAWRGKSFEKDLLASYQKELTTFLKKQNYPLDDRPFLNHTTLARSPFEKDDWEQAFQPLPYFIKALHLYESLGNLTYKPLWTHKLISPFEEFEHVADIGFRIHGESVKQIYLHAQIALTFECPELIPFLDPNTEVSTLEEVIIKLNEIITHGDREIGTPFKAVSFHGELKKEETLTWEMIVDV